MRIRSIRSKIPGLAAAMIASLMAGGFGAGCNTVSATSVCQQICDCQGCNQTETQACQAGFEKAEKLSGDQSCGDPYSTYVGCIADNLKCVNDKIDVAACVTEATALGACAKTIPITLPGGGGGPCDEYLTKAKACCDKVPDASARDQCHQIVDSVKKTNPPVTTCQAALNAFTCPY